jgi:phosphoserine phosphatase RsbU/P
MLKGLLDCWLRLSRMARVFLVAGATAAALYVSGFAPLLGRFIALIAVFLGALLLLRVARRAASRIVWRLRNRLVMAYFFIAVAPLILILAFVGIASYWVIGQMAVYLVNTELTRRAASLMEPAEVLARAQEPNQAEALERLTPLIRSRFPKFEVLIRGADEFRSPPNSALMPPPREWKDTSGLVLRDGRLYAWAHVSGRDKEVTMMAPIDQDFLASIVPGLGDVGFLRYTERTNPARIPQPANFLDFPVTGVYPVQIPEWESPAVQHQSVMIVQTRLSAVLGTVFGQTMNWSEVALLSLAVVAIAFFIVEILSLAVGVSLSRSITTAVDELYTGTGRIQKGDFSHRIPVKGRDQLAELGMAFNSMTANVERLIVIAKEKERLESELEIAREVQSQLFPKSAPSLRTFKLEGVCHPARMVSGDYYDFAPLPDGSVAFAIGDVAGKGISAALLMATIQSAMRTRLNAAVPVAAGAGAPNGGGYHLSAGAFNGGGHRLSSAAVVSDLNRHLYENTSPEKYATFFLGIYDEATRLLTYTNAGHLPPILVRKGAAQLLEVTGTVVGAFPFAQYDEKTAALESGDLLVAYTDGIVEPENAYGEPFGEDRLADLLVQYAKADLSEIIARVMETVTHWTGSSELSDDMTMLAARRI